MALGRLIVIVDETVWGLYGAKMEAWAESVELRLDSVVTPGNEDHKTMETFAFLLDELKRASWSTRAVHPVLRTAPPRPPWTIWRPRPRLRTPERRLSRLEACRGLRSSPQAAPRLRMFRF